MQMGWSYVGVEYGPSVKETTTCVQNVEYPEMEWSSPKGDFAPQRFVES